MPTTLATSRDYAKLLRAVKQRIAAIDLDLLAGVDGPLASPSQYRIRVESYCVLAHAALEESVEKICLLTMSKVLEMRLAESRVSESVLAFVAAHSERIKYPSDDRDESVSQSAVRHRDLLDACKTIYSQAIKENHGVGVKYLRKLLYPLAIDFDDTVLLSSLKQIAEARGDFAHTIGATRIVAPEDARKWVSDCVALVRLIALNSLRRVS